MPSDNPVRAVVEALTAARESFRTAVATTVDQVDTLLARELAGAGARSEEVSHALGNFAAGHVDFERFAQLVVRDDALPAAARERVTEAQQVLHEVARMSRDPIIATVPAGRSLRDAVAVTLALVGRAFGAALAVQLARTGRTAAEDHASLLNGFPFSRWNKAERFLGPPLIVEVHGADLQAGSLLEFLDGAQKIVLIVHEPAPPAPLVRCLSPGVFVMQTTDPAALAVLGQVPGPAIAALLPEPAACFVHDPARGGGLGGRLAITAIPEKMPAHAIGGISAAQQREELRLLSELGALGAGAAAGAMGHWAREAVAGQSAAAVPADPADLLAGWMLAQAGLAGQP